MRLVAASLPILFALLLYLYINYQQMATTNKLSPVDYASTVDVFEYVGTKLAPLLAKQSPIHLLEVGCGAGGLAYLLQQKYGSQIVYKGIDPSADAIKKAHDRGVVGAESIAFEDLPAADGSYDVVLFTKSFHHLPSIQQAVDKAYKVLKTGGLFICDEFAREVVDEPTATFVFKHSDDLEAAGKFPTPPRMYVSEDQKTNYLLRWQTRFPNSVTEHKSPEAGGHEHSHAHAGHAAHAGHHHGQHEAKCQGGHEHGGHEHGGHEHGGHEHGHAHGHAAHAGHHHQGKHEEQHGHEHGHSHGQEQAGHGHKHGHHHGPLPTSVEMIEAIKSKFPNLEVTTNSYLFFFITMRFEGSNDGEDILKSFKKEEEELIAQKKILPIGRRFYSTKA